LINSHLDWSEVREGGRQALEAEAKQRAEAEEREVKAREVVAQAQQAELQRQEKQVEALESTVNSRYKELSYRVERSLRRINLILCSFLGVGISIIIGFLGLWFFKIVVPYPTVMQDSIERFSGIVLLVTFIVNGIGIIFSFEQRSKLRRQLELFERERVSLETAVGGYESYSTLDALRSFAVRIEEIFRHPRSSGASTVSPAPPVDTTLTPGAGSTQGVNMVSRAQDIAPEVALKSMIVTYQKMETPGTVDVFLSYQPAPLTNDWVRDFTPLFQAWLSVRILIGIVVLGAH